jgi:hypothetical protein
LSSAIYIYTSQQHPPIFQGGTKKGWCVCQRKRWNHRFHSPPKVQAHLFFFSSATPSSSFQRGSYDYYIREMSLFRWWWSHSPVFIPFGHSLTISSILLADQFLYSSFLAVRDTYILRNMRFYLRTKGEWSSPAFCIFGARGCDATSSATHNSIIHWIVAISFFLARPGIM